MQQQTYDFNGKEVEILAELESGRFLVVDAIDCFHDVHPFQLTEIYNSEAPKTNGQFVFRKPKLLV